MPTVIDSLIVELGLDPKNFDAGRKKAAKDLLDTKDNAARTAKDIEASGARAAQFFGKLRSEAFKLFTLFTAGRGLKEFVTDTVKTDLAVGQLSKQIGLSTQELSAWQQVAQRNGATAESITGQLAGLASEFQQIQLMGDSPHAGLLWQLGIRPQDLNDANAALLKISDRLKSMDPKQAAFFGRQLGLDPALIDLLRKGGPQLRKELADATRRGVINEEDVKAARRLTEEFQDLKQASGAVGRELLTQAAPAIEQITGFLRELLVTLRDVKSGMNLSPETKALITDTASLASSSVQLAKALGELLAAFNQLGAAHGGPTMFERAIQSLDHLVRAATHSVRALTAALHGDLKTAGYEAAQAVIEGNTAALNQVGLRTERPGARAAPAAPATLPAPVAAARVGPVSADADAAVRTMIAEARAGDTVGQGDVAHVILNRQRRSGKSAGDIVKQKGQFEPWMTEAGRARMAAIDPNSKRYQDALAAWVKAYREQQAGVDPTGGATLFVSPGGQAAHGRDMPSWAQANAKTLERGGHQFYTGAFPGDKGVRHAPVAGGARLAAPAQQTGAAAAAVTNVQTQTNSVSVGQVVINTAATDAKGIARDIRPALSTAGHLAAQANSGIQ